MSNYICNPLDLSYRFQDVRFTGMVGGMKVAEPSRTVFREAADPSIVRYKGRYYAFVSMSRGFWHSIDLVDWTFQPTDKLPAEDYAPDVQIVDGALIVSASRKDENCPFFRSVDPLGDDFEELDPGTFPFWDPHVYQDDDGKVYFYWGCDNVEPVRGMEMTRGLQPAADAVDLLNSDIENRGWERTGEGYGLVEPVTEAERRAAPYRSERPYIEGAWMSKVDNRYYLQYAAPGTQWNSYADGYAVGSSPLGPFDVDPHSPFSSKPGGFITGAGHGSTFQDEHGNWWHAATMRVSIHHPFERRIGLFPAGFDDDGVLYCNQNFADYPLRIPTGRFDPWSITEPEWMLLSLNASASASSLAEGHEPNLATDEDIRTWWAAASSDPGEWLSVDLAGLVDVAAIQVNVADHEVAAHAPKVEGLGKDFGHSFRAVYPEHEPATYLVEGSPDGETWEVLFDGANGADRPHGLLVLDAPKELRHIRVTGMTMPFGATFAISGLRVFGRGRGERPGVVAPSVVRTSPLEAHLTWAAVPRAHGYNVRYGNSPDKLYRSWLIYGDTALTVPTLTAGQDAWFAVDAFNENGVTPGTPIAAAAPEPLAPALSPRQCPR